MPRPRSPHIVCFAPYTTWSIHSARQVAILQALRLRGCTVSYVTCDAVFSDCDVLQPGNGAPAQKPANACLICQSSVAARLAAWGMPYRWLGRWLTTEDFRAAAKWASALRPEELMSARYGEWDIGAWVCSSVHTHLRQNKLDIADQRTVAIYASYLYSGLLAATSFSRLLEEEKPDFMLLFNGRMGPMRTALELGKRQGVRALVEERGFVPGHLTLFENTHCIDGRALAAAWKKWADVPLSGEEIEALGRFLEARWRGQKESISYIISAEDAEETRAALRLDPERPVWALFTSNLDETVANGLADGVFESHDAWILASVAFARRRPDIQLVIRVHPNSGSRRSFSRNEQELAFYDALGRGLPGNVTLVRSDDALNSYNLAAIADVGLTWHSTIGLEMAALGKPVIRCGSPEINVHPFLPAPAEVEDFDRILDTLAAGRGPEPLLLARAAWRFAYLAYFRESFAFPLVKQSDWYMGDMNFESLDSLAPGRDAMLDRICEHVMRGAALHAEPPARGADIVDAETAAIGRWILSARPGKAR